MPGLMSPLQLPDAVRRRALIDLDGMPCAALISRDRDAVCVVANSAFEKLLGRPQGAAAGHALDSFFVAGYPEQCAALGEAALRLQDGTERMTSVLKLPVSHAGEPCTLCVFVERAARGWRNADLAAAIDEVIRDDMSWFGGAVLEHLARYRSRHACTSGLRQLTPRERQVLTLVCDGRDDAYIAAELSMARNTLRHHLANIYGKAAVKRRSEAVVWGRERGISTS